MPGCIAHQGRTSHHLLMFSALTDHFLCATGSTPEGKEASFSCFYCSWQSAAILDPGNPPVGRKRPGCITGKPLFLMLHHPVQDFREAANCGVLYVIFLFPFSTPPYSIPCPVQLLRSCHSLAPCCSSGMEIGSRFRSLGEKAKAYFRQLIHFISELFYKTCIEHLLLQPL